MTDVCEAEAAEASGEQEGNEDGESSGEGLGGKETLLLGHVTI